LAEQGFVEFCDGKMIDQDQILQYIEDCMNLYDIQQVNYDPAMSDKLVEKLENLGLECVEVAQYPKVLNAPFDDVERLFYEKRIQFDN
ncbi:terminase TerL endonuclease subunit, partial [Enterococcus faecium]